MSKKKDIALPEVDQTVRPDFELRSPYIYGQRFGTGIDNVMWQLRMGFNQAPDVVGLGYRAHGIAHVIGREETKTMERPRTCEGVDYFTAASVETDGLCHGQLSFGKGTGW